MGVSCSIELLQILVPFIGRSFDVDDIILNTIGSIIGTYLAIYISKNNIKKIPSTLRWKGSSYYCFLIYIAKYVPIINSIVLRIISATSKKRLIKGTSI